MSEFPKQGRIAGIDFGTVRIGIAVTDPDQVIASPYENYNRRTKAKDAEFFRKFAKDEKVAGFVVGLPVHMSGDSSKISEAAVKFGKWLGQETDTPVIWFDERYTSAMAEEVLSAGKLTKQQRKKRLDMLAAQILLAAFLESDRDSSDGRKAYLPSIDDVQGDDAQGEVD